MPRVPRQGSSSGIYHAMVRGVGQQRIFEDVEDHQRFLDILVDVAIHTRAKVLAYCLMSNHVHILLEEGELALSSTFRRLCIRYSKWFNEKYDRHGHLFQGRFRSEPVEDDAYMGTVVRYIHRNPVKAGFCDVPEDWPWSSYRVVLEGRSPVVDTQRLAQLVDWDSLMETGELCIDPRIVTAHLGRPVRFTDAEAAQIMSDICGQSTTAGFQKMLVPDQRSAVARLREGSVPIRQIARVTGLPRGVVGRWINGRVG